MKGLAVAGEALAVVAGLAFASAALVTADPGHLVLGISIAVAAVWSTIPVIAELWMATAAGRGSGLTPRSRWQASRESGLPESGLPESGLPESGLPDMGLSDTETGSTTALIRLGREPLDVARTTILLAADAGPTLVLAVDMEIPDELRSLGVTFIEAPSLGEAVKAAVTQVGTPGTLIVSARATPRFDSCAVAAAGFDDRTGWITGRTGRFNRDTYVHDQREQVTAALVARARTVGVDLWEPDATLVRTSLLHDHPLEPGAPMGSWLRARRHEGWMGTNVDLDLSLRAEPVDAAAFWPDALARQSGRVADLASLARSDTRMNRRIGRSLLLRELFAVPLLIWLGVAISVAHTGTVPFSASAPTCFAIAIATTLTRWLAARWSLGVRPRPLHDIDSTLHHLPGSLAAIRPAATAKLPSRVSRLPTRPLVWAAMALTAIAGVQLVAASRSDIPMLGVALSLTMVGLLWTFSLSALAQRNWERNTYRIPMNLELIAGGVSMRTINASPSGVAVRSKSEGMPDGTGTSIPIAVVLDDHSTLTCSASVAGRRTINGEEVIGLALTFDDDARRLWVNQLRRSAEGPKDPTSLPKDPTSIPKDPTSRYKGPTSPPTRSGRESPLIDPVPSTPAEKLARAINRVIGVVVGTIIVGFVAALALILLGFAPLVIRSGSMVPALSVGDVVISTQVAPSLVRPGDIVTVPSDRGDGNDSITHRVVRVRTSGTSVLLDTKGDANRSGETSRLDAGTQVGRAVWTIPWLGLPASWARALVSPITATLVLVGVGIAVFARRRR